VCGAVLEPSRQLVCRRATGTRNHQTHFREVSVDEVLGTVDATRSSQSASRRQNCTSCDARCPDVAEYAALVADPVHQPRLSDQSVELSPVLFWYLLADGGDPLVDACGGVCSPGN
jgi:hypothetical protein